MAIPRSALTAIYEPVLGGEERVELGAAPRRVAEERLELGPGVVADRARDTSERRLVRTAATATAHHAAKEPTAMAHVTGGLVLRAQPADRTRPCAGLTIA